MDNVKESRRKNFITLSQQLDKYNMHKWHLGNDAVPLCYPLIIDRNVEYYKERLIGRGIFMPTYWPEIKSTMEYNTMEYRLSNCCLFVPCDQRYSSSDMNSLAKDIISIIDNDNMSAQQ